jgi:Mat/Ecp fimbriae outer membrane usher protein
VPLRRLRTGFGRPRPRRARPAPPGSAARRRWRALALLGLAAAAPAPAAGAEPLLRTSIPAGFENLSAPQSALVDVYFLGKQVDVAMATFAPGKFAFADPEAVVARLPQIASPGVVTLGLTGDLDPNAALACGAKPRPGCGELQPTTVGIIFEATQFRVDVFVAPALLQTANGPRYLPDPEAGFSALQTLSGAVAGSSSNDTDYTLRSFSLVAYDTGRLRSETSLTSADGANLDVLAGEVDRHGWRYIGGLYRTALASLLGERRLMGAGIASTAETRLDLEQIEGTPITIFLPGRAQVEVLRDGRLLSSRAYPAGNQAIDTAALPQGAYEITLRIRQTDGTVREETRFFAKTSLVPPRAAPRYVLEAGLLGTETTSLTRFAQTPAAHAGTTHRLTDAFALGSDVVVTTSQQSLEVSAFYLATFSTFSVSGLGAVDGSVGTALNAYGVLERFSYGMSARRIWAAEDGNGGRRADPARLAWTSSTRLDVSLSYAFAGPRLGLRASWHKQEGRDGYYSYGPTLFWPLPPQFGSRLDLMAEATRSRDEIQAMVRLRVLFESEHYSISSDQGYVASFGDRPTSESGAVGRVDAFWRDGDLMQGDLRAGGGVIREFGDNAIRAQTDYQGPNGNGLGYVEHEINDAETLYGGNALISVLGNADRVTWGGEDAFRSGVLIAVTGDADAAFTILVDGRPHGTVKVGQRLALLLPEYEAYAIRLQPIGAPPVLFDTGSREVSLYPGTVKTLEWQVATVFVVFGRLLDAAGAPLAYAPIDGGIERAYTDANGYFQVEVAGAAELKAVSRGAPCTLRVEGQTANAELTDLGEVSCR